jgi:hypothetical protein
MLRSSVISPAIRLFHASGARIISTRAAIASSQPQSSSIFDALTFIIPKLIEWSPPLQSVHASSEVLSPFAQPHLFVGLEAPTLPTMPAPKLQPAEAAREQIVDMLEAMSSPDGFGFSAKALDHKTIKLVSAERSEDGKTSKVVVEMQVSGRRIEPAQGTGTDVQ